MKKRGFVFFFLLFLLLGALPARLFAQIEITKRTGSLFVATEKGEVFTLSPSDALPKLSSGSVVEVLSGSAEFKVEGSEVLSIVGGEAVINLTGGSRVALDVSNNGAETVIHVLNGDPQAMLSESIVALKNGAVVEAAVSNGKVSVRLIQGEAALVEFGGALRPLAAGQSYDVGSVSESDLGTGA
jgi:hypothetical protein